MTADELRAIALRLSSSCYVRHWLHWNFPTRSPWVMAIQCRDASGWPVKATVPECHGLEWDEVDRTWYADRTDEDGTPYGGGAEAPRAATEAEAEGLLPSIGASVVEEPGALIYRLGRDGEGQLFCLRKDNDWAVIRSCVDDAERRAKGRGQGS